MLGACLRPHVTASSLVHTLHVLAQCLKYQWQRFAILTATIRRLSLKHSIPAGFLCAVESLIRLAYQLGAIQRVLGITGNAAADTDKSEWLTFSI